MSPRAQHGFSLLSLLAALAIGAVLASMLFGAVNRARGKALEVKCIANLRQIGVALRLYLADHNGTYPPNRSNLAYQTKDNPGGLHWQNALKAYLKPFPDTGNITSEMAGVFWCPADVARKDRLAQHSYGANSYIGGLEPQEKQNIRNEPYPSRRLYLVEASRDTLSTCNFSHNVWPFNNGSPDNPDTNIHVDFRHGNLANGLFLDGRVASFEFKQLRGQHPASLISIY